jgi:hypothetical protein
MRRAQEKMQDAAFLRLPKTRKKIALLLKSVSKFSLGSAFEDGHQELIAQYGQGHLPKIYYDNFYDAKEHERLNKEVKRETELDLGELRKHGVYVAPNLASGTEVQEVLLVAPGVNAGILGVGLHKYPLISPSYREPTTEEDERYLGLYPLFKPKGIRGFLSDAKWQVGCLLGFLAWDWSYLHTSARLNGLFKLRVPLSQIKKADELVKKFGHPSGKNEVISPSLSYREHHPLRQVVKAVDPLQDRDGKQARTPADDLRSVIGFLISCELAPLAKETPSKQRAAAEYLQSRLPEVRKKLTRQPSLTDEEFKRICDEAFAKAEEIIDRVKKQPGEPFVELWVHPRALRDKSFRRFFKSAEFRAFVPETSEQA